MLNFMLKPFTKGLYSITQHNNKLFRKEDDYSSFRFFVYETTNLLKIHLSFNYENDTLKETCLHQYSNFETILEY